MSIAAALGNMGLALRDINNEQRAQNIQDEEIAARREERKQSGQLRGLQIGEAMNTAADRQKQRGYADAYDSNVKTAANPEELALLNLKKAKELGDSAGFSNYTQQVASIRAASMKRDLMGGVDTFHATGDGAALAAAYSKYIAKDGAKMMIEPVGASTGATTTAAFGPATTADPATGMPSRAVGMPARQSAPNTPQQYRVTMVGADGKIQGQPTVLSKDDIGRTAFKIMDPKFAEDLMKAQILDELKDKREINKVSKQGEIKLNQDKQLENLRADRAYDLEDMRGKREAANIGLRGTEERKTGASNAAAHGLQSRLTNADKAKLEGNSPEKVADAMKFAEKIIIGSFKANAMGGIDPATSLDYLAATASAERMIAAGMPPAAAAERAVAEAKAATKANKMAPKAADGAAPRFSLPAYQ